jgi:hypothetical protein
MKRSRLKAKERHGIKSGKRRRKYKCKRRDLNGSILNLNSLSRIS